MKKRFVVYFLLITCGVTLLFGLPESGLAWGRVVRCEALELVGPGGQIRARLNLEADGNIVLRLMDEDGMIHVKLGASKKGSGLVLLNDSTEVGVHLLADGSMRLKDKKGREKLVTP